MPNLSIHHFWKLADLMTQAHATAETTGVVALRERLRDLHGSVEDQAEILERAAAQILEDVHRTTLHNKPKRPFHDDRADISEAMSIAASHGTFLGVVTMLTRAVVMTVDDIVRKLDSVDPGEVVVPDDSEQSAFKGGFKGIRLLSTLVEINRAEIEGFVVGLSGIRDLKSALVHGAVAVAKLLDAYYQILLKRHGVDGIQIHDNPIATDIAISVFDNIDRNGEIEDGVETDRVSAYSRGRAITLVEVARSQATLEFIRYPERFVQWIESSLQSIWDAAETIEETYRPIIVEVDRMLGVRDRGRDMSRSEFMRNVAMFREMNPNAVPYRDKAALLSPEERFVLKFRNESLRHVVSLLQQEATHADVVDYILGRKAELHRYFTEQNSFYVCKIGDGNQFLGRAPGGLEVIPGIRPSVSMDDLVGAGFDDLRAFVTQGEAAQEWADLFQATSPSRTADKSNVLLVGPQGCGKTEAMRAIGADGKSVSIFAQGSDFMTCWSGEAQKNPKRLFEAAVKLRRESKRHIYLLIDEIDQVLHNDHTLASGSFNLTREFQILMDGVVHYPGISVWGATNHPERIPMPMIRRFNRVMVVGELSVDERAKLLKTYADTMPTAGFGDDMAVWFCQALRLDGATGDVIRKIIDPIWRQKMHDLVHRRPDEAKRLSAYLNRNGRFDVREFNAGERFELKLELAKLDVSITPQDVSDSIDHALGNIAILNEIRVAKETYAAARLLVADLGREQGRQPADGPQA